MAELDAPPVMLDDVRWTARRNAECRAAAGRQHDPNPDQRQKPDPSRGTPRVCDARSWWRRRGGQGRRCRRCDRHGRTRGGCRTAAAHRRRGRRARAPVHGDRRRRCQRRDCRRRGPAAQGRRRCAGYARRDRRNRGRDRYGADSRPFPDARIRRLDPGRQHGDRDRHRREQSAPHIRQEIYPTGRSTRHFAK
jgi:hypothetical protein